MSVDFANGTRATLGDPGEESRRAAASSCRLLVRALVLFDATHRSFQSSVSYSATAPAQEPGEPKS